MPAVSVAGAAINLSVDAVQYESQITTGTITTTPTIVRTKTLDSVAFDQTDLNSTMSVDFLYDENAGLYDALQTAIASASSVAVIVASATGTWTGSTMSIDGLDLNYDATGVVTASLSLTGDVTFA
jgi:hypothetical protein